MKPQDFVCPACGRTLKARRTHPLRDGDYFYPADSVAVLARQGYHWIETDEHMREGVRCPGSGRRYYVGDANL